MFWNVFKHIIMVDTYLYAPQNFFGRLCGTYLNANFLIFFGNVFVGMQIFRPSPRMLAWKQAKPAWAEG